jgi:RimJ/RimL family protein N-acetyltransferase
MPGRSIDNAFTVRALLPAEWERFRDLRLRALKMHPGFYAMTYEQSVRIEPERWQALLDGDGKRIFGLFQSDELIGITAVFTHRDDPTGQTGMLAMSFIVPEYRGRGLSHLLYKARIEWAQEQKHFIRLITSHREGNEPSRRANQAFHFKLTTKSQITWPDGANDAEWGYVLDLTPGLNTLG